jgi:hypothetical protein
VTFAPVFGYPGFQGHTFFYGAAAVPAASADDSFNVQRVGFVSSPTDTTFSHSTSDEGQEMFTSPTTVDLAVADLLPATRVSSCQGHDGEIYIAVEKPLGSVTVRSVFIDNDPFPPTYNVDVTFAGYSPLMFTSRVFTGRLSTSATYCFYTDADGEKLYSRTSADGFAAETEVLTFPAPVEYLQGINRVGLRLLFWAMTKGDTLRDVHQLVMYSEQWENPFIREDSVAHEASVTGGSLYESVFSPPDVFAEGANNTAGVLFGNLREEGEFDAREAITHEASVLYGSVFGDVLALPEAVEGATSAAGVLRGSRFAASEVGLDKSRHHVGVTSGEMV